MTQFISFHDKHEEFDLENQISVIEQPLKNWVKFRHKQFCSPVTVNDEVF